METAVNFLMRVVVPAQHALLRIVFLYFVSALFTNILKKFHQVPMKLGHVTNDIHYLLTSLKFER